MKNSGWPVKPAENTRYVHSVALLDELLTRAQNEINDRDHRPEFSHSLSALPLFVQLAAKDRLRFVLTKKCSTQERSFQDFGTNLEVLIST